ncbi:shikimate kinase [Parafannyhessea umbonata]|uniref:Shikimate kinase n=1 Tax=Parafannyhessea umbonata TaxID=604330 RepID=A0A1H1L0K4_9ACTN|nr:shikimate kinase [Parafannyhessea umbonata]SDR68101.1 shikimate kinase [Parafannyhessea umbonata]
MKHSENGYVVHEGCDHIFFVGFLGAGKSTLARNLGVLFNRDFVDTDRMVERMAKKTVCQIFHEDGEARFRELEAQVLEGLAKRKSLLVSCGGGIVEGERSCELMHAMGTVVFLDGDVEDSLRQIQHPEIRPDFKDEACARRLYRARRPLYEQEADLRIDIRHKSFEQVTSEAGQLLWEKGLL